MLEAVGEVVAVADAVSCRAMRPLASIWSIARADVRVPAAQRQRYSESLILASLFLDPYSSSETAPARFQRRIATVRKEED